MKDHMIRGITGSDNIRFFVATTTNLCEEVRLRHNMYPTAAAALGRLLTASLLMGYNLKNEELITLRVAGDGPIGNIIATADSDGHVKGFVTHPETHLPSKEPGKLDVGSAVGNGTFSVTRDMGLEEKYNSSIPLVTGEIGDDIAAYYVQSEQIPTAVGFGVLVETDGSVKSAGGYIVQAMPGVSDEELSRLEENIAKLKPVSALIDEGLSPSDIATLLLDGFEVRVLDQKDVSFKCSCSKDRFRWVLEGLGEDDINSLIAEDNGAEIMCHYCGNKYQFSTDELKSIVE